MSIQTSVLTELLQTLPQGQATVRPQSYFKSSLTALSHAMEDLVLAGSDSPLIIANFQRERFYRQEAHRYQRIAQKSDYVYVLSAPETDFKNHSGLYETIAFQPTDALSQEWHLVVIGQQYASCLICRERSTNGGNDITLEMDTTRRFEGVWTFDWQICSQAADILLNRVLHYRPELADKVAETRTRYTEKESIASSLDSATQNSLHSNPDPFVQRLVTYLQAGQYKLIKAYRSLSAKEQKERLIRSMTVAIRQSLNPEAILQVAVERLGEAIDTDRCLIYRCKQTDTTAIVQHESLADGIPSLEGQVLPLKNHPFFQAAVKQREVVNIENALEDDRIQDTPLPELSNKSLRDLIEEFGIISWLLVPIFYQDQLLGMMELHRCRPSLDAWTIEEMDLVDAIANQVGVALIQAEAYANLEDLNEQLEALDRTRSNLVAITGHELRTPLSTIQVCLESLASEPDMSPELRQVMLNAALTDGERMRKLIQDFLTLSQLESGRVQWHPEAVSLEECVYLSLSHTSSRSPDSETPQINTQIAEDLPLVRADGEWLVEVLAKLLDNAFKFTGSKGEVIINAERSGNSMLEVTVTDTGRGIEPNRLETVFDRFYQEEGALRRTTGGTGLGLAICRQIVHRWGGEIWAESLGKNQGSKFHFTVPIFQNKATSNAEVQDKPKSSKKATSQRKTKKKGTKES